jgi:hypothetical protein
MEKINQHNYEAFYLDYLEGNLNEIDQAMLFKFLDDNLDFKAELEDDILEYTISSDSDKLTAFEKEDLKHFDCHKGEICLNNVNDFIISDLENDISSQKKKELNAFIIEHELESDKKYFYATKLKPNLSEVFDDKSELKKKGVIIPLFLKIASIAAVALLLFNFIGSNEAQYYSQRDSSFVLNEDTLDYTFEINLADNNSIKTVILKEDKQQKNQSNPKENLPQYAEVITDSIEPTIQDVPDFNDDIVIENSKPSVIDTSKTPLIIENPVFNDDIVQAPNPTEQIDNGIKLIDMYQPITNLTNSYTSLDVSYKKSTDDSKYQVTNIKLGKFSFERKRNK